MDPIFPVIPTTKRTEAIPRSPFMNDPLKTPVISATPRLDDDHSTSYFACIENGSKEVGAALFKLNPPSLALYQFSDTSLYSYVNNLIELHQPTKILIPLGSKKSPLSQLLISQNADGKITEVPRSHFNDKKGTSLLHEFSHSPNEIFESCQLTNRYLCLSSASAVIQYAQSEESVDIYPNSLQTIMHTLEGHLMIDPLALMAFSVLSVPNKNTCIKISTSKRKNAIPSLFNIVDRTLTTCGGRFLRATLATPPSDPRHILLRNNFVQELVMSEELRNNLSDAIADLTDLDDSISFLVTKYTGKKETSSRPLDCLIRISHNGHSLNKLKEALANMTSPLAKGMLQSLNDSMYDQLTNIIDEFIEYDPSSYKTAFKTDISDQIYCVKENIVPLLDVTRKTYESTLQSIFKTAKDISDRLGIQVRVKYNKSRRFHLQINKKEFEGKSNTLSSIASSTTSPEVIHTPSGLVIPAEFIYVIESQQAISATTYDLLLLNTKNESAQIDSIALAHKYIETRIDDIRHFVSSIYAVSEVIGFVDTLLSFSKVAVEYDGYTKPVVGGNMLQLKQARHPIIEQIYNSQLGNSIGNIMNGKDQKFVPNDLTLTVAKRLLILGGVNMSGKSTLLQTIALNIIMAQSGGFVPCEYAEVPIFTTLFSRSGGNDSIESNASAFAVEMKEMGHIMSQADENSLILIDEPGSSTSPSDGSALSWAVLEKLLEKKAYTIVSTHFRELEEFSSTYPTANTCTMKSKINDNGGFDFSYKISEGECTEESYGIKVAAPFLPFDTIEYAKEVYKKVLSDKQIRKKPSGMKAATAILQRLIALKSSSLDDEGLRQYLISMKNRCNK